MDPGSIQEVTERLTSWCNTHDHGLVRAEWDSAYARHEVVSRLSKSFPVAEIELPPGESGHETAERLIEKLKSRNGSVVSITGIEWAFPEGGNRLETLAALSFQRETLASLPVRQIWWIRSSLTERFVLGVPDLDSWFRLRLHLTEIPPQTTGQLRRMEETDRKAVSVAEARSVARRFWERLESARAQGTPEERIWAELAEPAVKALRSAGLQVEAESILASTSAARESLERELQELRSRRGPEDLEVLGLSEQLARLLWAQGDRGRAGQIHEQLLELAAHRYGEDHPAALSAINNLAEVRRIQGNHVEARRLHQRVLERRKRVLGEEHPETLGSMNNLALTLEQAGDFAGARWLQERVLEVRSRVMGEEHPDTLAAMSNLATTLAELHDYAGAHRLQERVVELRTLMFGEEHPDTLRSLNNFAVTLQREGNLSRARSLLGRLLSVSTRTLGPEHPLALTSMVNLAETFLAEGDQARALELLQKALVGMRKVLGPAHPDTLAYAELLKDWEARQYPSHSVRPQF